MRWQDFRLISEEYLPIDSDYIYDIKFAMNESMLCCAQREAVYVYNTKCVETHVLKRSMLLPLALELFHNKSISLDKLISSMTWNPAKILEISKGTLDIGNDADLCVLDINKAWIVKQSDLRSKSKNTPIENRKLQGQVMKTFVNGEIVFERT